MLAARGWTVLLLNPRASDGYGEAFYTAAVGAWGVADANDFLEPIDELVAEGVADPARLAVTGYCYGGFMTCYLTSRDDRFAAAVAGGVVTDLTSMAGTSDDAHFLSVAELGALPWGGDRERLAELTPYTQVDDVTTPTLVLHGDADVRCPVGQAEQWHVALRELGVDTDSCATRARRTCSFSTARRHSHRLQPAGGGLGGTVREDEQAAAEDRRRALAAPPHGARRAAQGPRRPARHPAASARAAARRARRRPPTGTPTATSRRSQATTDTLFQIGSISKVWTATVVMQLVDEGKLDLDTPHRRHPAGLPPRQRRPDRRRDRRPGRAVALAPPLHVLSRALPRAQQAAERSSSARGSAGRASP